MKTDIEVWDRDGLLFCPECGWTWLIAYGPECCPSCEEAPVKPSKAARGSRASQRSKRVRGGITGAGKGI